MLRISLVFLLSFICLYSFSAKNIDTLKVQTQCKEIHTEWIKTQLELTKNTAGYSAPVAARTFSYITVGMYESVVELLPENQTLSNQLTDFNRKTWLANNEKVSFPYVSLSTNYHLTSYFFDNMPPSWKKKTELLFLEMKKRYKRGVSKKTIQRSLDYGKQLAAEIIAWAQKDGASQSWNKNFPKDFKPKVCEGCWQRTNPGFVDALQPYWGENRRMILSNETVCDTIPSLHFSTDSTSSFYQQNKMILDHYQHISEEEKTIAKYWDDAPGITGTPIGHLISIALQIAIKENMNLKKTVELFSLLSIAVNDAFIESWKLKYHYNLIRPITYIQKYITPTFSTVINTPPFPEFPSGHSFQAGAATSILNKLFGNQLAFTDETNQNRTDMNGTPRSYRNFSEMGEEMSTSRFYGGIHYEKTLQISLDFGKIIGNNTLQSIQFNKK